MTSYKDKSMESIRDSDKTSSGFAYLLLLKAIVYALLAIADSIESK